MPELVYPPVIAACKTMFRVLDLKITIEGAHHVPRTGGAVLAANHVSYLDFIFCGLGAQESKRLVRFMAKSEVFAHKVSGPLMRGMRHISVNRAAGAGSFNEAMAALRRGEVVGVFPEATISRSFTVKSLKTGTVRMAQEAGVPVLPVALWGGQRIWTKDRKPTLTRHVPITILIGEPLDPAGYQYAGKMNADLKARLTALVDRAQREYPDQPSGPDDAWWQPAHLGGTAPTPEQAAAMEGRPPRPAPTA
ncbi:lysophospholipid acyltransferase family protein [Micromonospora cathayae]|uniref:Lysophospholipid acyltransferase family protein n=1 Tax=Micromonospora cathayae TaxID=3028804 RepID=A0ABY7ZRU9_9ACTN|nr:lysophospholipid acyltransferase family protein [Micromonospora sp. HUAS 3]WDZ84927.1 lysophospholipid acyltransferase family protein [Micromonospora sp. HUAS 3]